MHDTRLPHHKLEAYGVAMKLLEAVREAKIRDTHLRDQAMRARLALLRAISIGTWRAAPQGLDAHSNALLEAPEGTSLLFLEESS